MKTKKAPRNGKRLPESPSLTIPQKLLVAAWRLQDQEGGYFLNLEELTIASWRTYPLTFGLRGFERKYPDSNRISATLFHERSPLNTGHMARHHDNGLYFVTAAGAIEAGKIADSSP